MSCLADTDIVSKFVICDLIDEAIAALGFSRADVLVLPEARDRLRVGRRWDKAVDRYGLEISIRIRDFLDSVKVLNETFSVEELLIFENFGSSVHPGEALLVLASLRHPDSTVITGDKKCLKALASEPELRMVAQSLKGRIICFEQLLYMVIQREKYDHVARKVMQLLPFDGAMRLVFSQGEETKEDQALYGLGSMLRDIKSLEFDILGEIDIPGCGPNDLDGDLGE